MGGECRKLYLAFFYRTGHASILANSRTAPEYTVENVYIGRDSGKQNTAKHEIFVYKTMKIHSVCNL
jgi:hypothetical protein